MKLTWTRKSCCLALGILLIPLSCYLPPFNADMSMALVSSRKMDFETSIGPVDRWQGDAVNRIFYFIPLKEDLGRGFLAELRDNSIELQFLNKDDDGRYRTEGGRGISLTNADEQTLNYRVESLKGDTALALFRFNMDNYAQNQLYIFNYTPPDMNNVGVYPVILKDFIDLGPSYPLSVIMGAHIFPLPQSSADDVALFLCKLDGGGYREVVYPINSTGLGSRSDLRTGATISLDLPAGLENAFYYYHPPTQTSYLNYYSDSAGSYKTYTWDDSLTPQTLSGITERIDALLSTGELFCADSTEARVYDPAGSLRYAFPLGALRFLFEYHDGKEYRLLFCLSYWRRDHELFLELYSIATADLDELDD